MRTWCTCVVLAYCGLIAIMSSSSERSIASSSRVQSLQFYSSPISDSEISEILSYTDDIEIDVVMAEL